jgi:hypothetical protein
MFFMHLYVGPELETTMFVIVNIIPCQNEAGTHGGRNSIIWGEIVQPKHASPYHLNKHNIRYMLEGLSIISAPNPFL